MGNSQGCVSLVVVADNDRHDDDDADAGDFGGVVGVVNYDGTVEVMAVVVLLPLLLM